MDFDKNDVWTGACVLAVLALFVAGLLFLNHKRFTAETYAVEIHLPNIAGVEKGVDVIYKGYKAGAVERVTIAYEPEFKFIVTLAIKSEIELRWGTKVMVRNKGFGGAKFIELSPPPDENSGQAVIEAGSVLPVEQAPDLMTKANAVLAKVENVVRDFQNAKTGTQVQEAMQKAKSALENLDSLLANANALVAENRKALKSSVDNANGLTAKSNALLTKNEKALSRAIANIDESMVHVPAIMKNVEELTAELKRNPWRLIRKGKVKETDFDHSHSEERKKGKK